jgi:DNA excision repair protein ERCC-4
VDAAPNTAAGHRRFRAPKPKRVLLVDSREQRPFQFTAPVRAEFDDGGVSVLGLSEGDYAIAIDGLAPLSIRIERKSLSDFYGCVGNGRDRFVRELERLTQYQHRALVIEGSLSDVIGGFDRSAVHPKSAIGSLIAWSVRYGLAIWFAETHARAADLTQRALEAFAVDTLRASKEQSTETNVRMNETQEE